MTIPSKPVSPWRSSSGEPFNPNFHQTCDLCAEPGMSDSDGFVMPITNGQVFCRHCARKMYDALKEGLGLDDEGDVSR